VPLGDGEISDAGRGSEEVALRDPEAEAGWMWSATEPQDEKVRIAGKAVLDLTVSASGTKGQLAPTLVDVAPDGSTMAISRGFLNLEYRDGLEAAKPVEPGTPMRVRVRFAPQDHTVLPGHRIGVIVAGSNVVWALPPEQPSTLTVEDAKLRLPVVER
jgi:predicted acyl esterase